MVEERIKRDLMKDLIIVGGGASGMLCAILLSPYANTLIIEKNDRLGKKLLTTGNGRCNYTNEDLSNKSFHSEYDEYQKFLERINSEEIIKIFDSLGIAPYAISNGRIYPNSLQASSVLDALRFAIEERKIDIRLNENIKSIEKKSDFYEVKSDDNSYSSSSVLIATGGMAMPKSGSDGGGYKFFKGHQRIDTLPSLVQLTSDFPHLKAMDGVKCEVMVSLLIDEEKVQSEFGDLLFTNYGISGPTVLDISRKAVRAVRDEKKVEASIKLIEVSTEELKERFENLNMRDIEKAMIGLIHKKLILPILKTLGIDKDKLAPSLTDTEIEKLSKILRDFRINITGDKGFGSAQTTQGGLSLKDFNPHTLESKYHKGLYATGEILDIDGDCGGYNLSWAWYSAMKVANSIKEKKIAKI